MSVRYLPLLLIGLLVVGCSGAAPRRQVVSSTPTPQLISVLTPDTAEVRYRPEPIIGQLVLATTIGPDEAPKDEASTIPANTRQLYLVVRATDLPAGARLSAIWLRGTSEIGRSERQLAAAASGPHWIALPLQSDTPLVGGEYSVRLYLNDRFIDSLVFTVGGRRGELDEQAMVVFATDQPSGAGPIEAQSVFPPGTRRIVAILANVSPDVAGDLWSRWTVNGSVLTEIGADDPKIAFVRTFTLQRDEPLPPGNYTVQIFTDQQEIAQGSFTVAGATPTPEPSQAVVEDVRIVRTIEPGTGLPVGARLREIQAPARVYVAILVRDLQPTDELRVVWERAGNPVSQQPLSGHSYPANWISLPFDIPAEQGTELVLYRVTVWLNGNPAGEATVIVHPSP
ncbi:MAG: hypothetical protein ACK42I_06330 [Thermomicrobium sp.]